VDVALGAPASKPSILLSVRIMTYERGIVDAQVGDGHVCRGHRIVVRLEPIRIVRKCRILLPK